MSTEGFSNDSIFITILNRIGDALILSVIFTLCCVPVVTIGPALTALYYTAMKGVTGDSGYVFKNFMKRFKQNFKQSLIMWLIFLVVFGVLGVDAWFWNAQDRLGAGMLAKGMEMISVIMLVIAVMIFLYAFPLQAKFDNKIKVQLRNAFLLSVKYFPTTLLALLILLVVVWVFYYQPLVAIVGFVLVGFGAYGYLMSYLMLKCFAPFLPKQQEKDDYDSSDMSE